MNKRTVTIFLCFILGITFIAIILIVACSRENSSLHWGIDPSQAKYSCGQSGCEGADKANEGEYKTLGDCEDVCRSWRKEGEKCKETKGVPWDSYATKQLCEGS